MSNNVWHGPGMTYVAFKVKCGCCVAAHLDYSGCDITPVLTRWQAEGRRWEVKSAEWAQRHLRVCPHQSVGAAK